ncbi:glycosyltransferase [Roseomonas sp. GCM10028921]
MQRSAGVRPWRFGDDAAPEDFLPHANFSKMAGSGSSACLEGSPTGSSWLGRASDDTSPGVSEGLMRILVASNFFPPHTVGGAEIVADRHARELVRRGHDVLAIGGSVPAPGRPPGSLEPEFYNGLEIQRLALRSLDPDDSFRWPSVARRIASFVASRGVDVVHLHNLVGLGVDSILAARAAGARCVVTLHDHWGFCLRQTLLRRDMSLCRNFEECAACQRSFEHEGERLPIRLRRDYTAWCLEQADALISPSRYLADAYGAAGVAPGTVEVLSNGLDLTALPPAAGRGGRVIRFLCSANLSPHKGIGVLLDAARRLMEETMLAGRWQIVLVGGGALHKTAQLLAQELASQAGAAWHAAAILPLIVTGHLPRAELLTRMAEADVVVLPSIWPENEPVTLLEGAAMGAALLVTQAGGSADLVEHDKTGLLVPKGDAAALAEAMHRLITENGLAARLGAANLARRASLDEARTVDRLEALYAGTSAPPKPDAADRPRRPVVLVGSGSAPEDVIELVGRLHQHVGTEQVPRFLRRDWVTEAAWSQASLLWLWDGKDAQAAVLAALRHDIPVLAPAGIGLEHWVGAGAPVLTYRSALEALAALQVLLGHPATRQHLVRETSLAADAVWSAPRDAFALLAEKLF